MPLPTVPCMTWCRVTVIQFYVFTCDQTPEFSIYAVILHQASIFQHQWHIAYTIMPVGIAHVPQHTSASSPSGMPEGVHTVKERSRKVYFFQKAEGVSQPCPRNKSSLSMRTGTLKSWKTHFQKAEFSGIHSKPSLMMLGQLAVQVVIVMFLFTDPVMACYKFPPGKKNPCQDHPCNFGAICVPSLDGTSHRCTCQNRCDSYGDNVGSTPVCGNNGVDYKNMCELERAACTSMKEIRVKYFGKCGMYIMLMVLGQTNLYVGRELIQKTLHSFVS